MNPIRRLLEWVDNFFTERANLRRDAYLAQAHSLEDLERRMRDLESRTDHPLI
ncbi:MAG: DUF3563 family protein [Burkholderiales bacterium]